MIDNPHKFQSTRPSRASTSVNLKIKPPSDISIHKALTGLDNLHMVAQILEANFNPQGPHGPRLYYT